MNFRYKLMQFMSGRYGVDNLFYILFGISVAISVVNIFVRSIVLQLIGYAFIVYAIIRMFSKNTSLRAKENNFISNKLNYFKRKRDFAKQRRDDKCHVYKKCPSCKAILRLPRRVGVHKTSCPKCGNEFTVKVRK